MKIILFGNSLKGMIQFRKLLIEWLAASGHEVYLITPIDIELAPSFFSKQVTILHIDFSRSINSYKECKSLHQGWRYIKEIKPDVVFAYTLKISMLAMFLTRKIPLKCFITGIGSSLTNKKYKYAVTSFIFILQKIRRRLLGTNDLFIFLNQENQNLFIQNKLSQSTNSVLIPGEGMDLDFYKYTPILAEKKPFTFLFIGRYIRDKGVLELIQACERIKANNHYFRCILISPVDTNNPTSLHQTYNTNELQHAGIEYIAYASDVRPYIADSHCLVLPSYGEGLPFALLEGMSMGRPIICTKVPGCTELVENNNGLLVEVKSVPSLYEAMLQMMQKTTDELNLMGLNGHQLVKEKYSIACVLNKYQTLLEMG